MVLVFNNKYRGATLEKVGAKIKTVKCLRLTRSLSAPRRCNSCRKMVYFTALRCKDCGNVTHESCATDCAHQCPATARRRSYQPSSPTVMESEPVSSHSSSDTVSHQPPVPSPSSGNYLHPGYQRQSTPAKPARILSQLPLRSPSNSNGSKMSDRDNKSSKCSPLSSPNATTPSPVSSPGSSAITLSGLLKVVHWLSQRRRSRDFSKANAADKHVKSKFGLTPDTFDEKIAHKRLKSFLKTAAHKRNSIAECGGATSYYHPPPNTSNQGINYSNVCPCGRFHDQHVDGVVPAGHYPNRGAFRRQTSLNSTRQAFFASPNNSVSSSGCFSSTSSTAHTPSDNETERTTTNTIPETKVAPASTNNAYRVSQVSSPFVWSELSNPSSSTCPVPGFRFFSDRTDSTASRLTVSPISSIVSSEVFLRSSPTPALETGLTERDDIRRGNPVGDIDGGSGGMLSRHGRFGRHCFSHKARTFSVETGTTNAERLCSTWPPAGKGNPTIDELHALDDSESGIGDCDIGERKKSRSDSVKETLGEWCIPYNDLVFKECLVHGINGDIFRGQWHGEVLIYKFVQNTGTDTEVQQFLDEVAQLCMIRHENILLFMGACIEPPHLAIITSMRKGPSLYEQIHLKRHTLPMHTKFSIVRQVAQGMSYLHAKGILHRKLSSRNIILESRVKICIMDQAVVDRTQDRPDFGCIPRGYLCYLSPELMQSLNVEPPRLRCVSTHTQESDVYSFGTLLYEILMESYPFAHQSSHSIIWQIGCGKHATVNDVKCTSSIRTLLLECWETNPTHRPSFSYINRQLQENVSLHRRHSSSEPERLNRAGLQTSLAICA